MIRSVRAKAISVPRVCGLLLGIFMIFPAVPAETSGSHQDPGSLCAGNPELRSLRTLDFGDARILRGREGFLSVSPRGAVSNSIGVLVQRGPQPGELSLCGRGNQEIAIVVDQPTLPLQITDGGPVARLVKNIEVEGDGIALMRVEQGRWHGRLGATGRAIVRVGATLYFASHGSHGLAGGDIAIDAVAR